MTGQPLPCHRLDARFLLPESGGDLGHLAVLGGGDALAEAAAGLGLARRVSAALPETGTVDAILRLHGAAVPLEAAARRLAPGGFLFWEGARPRRAEAALRRAGLRPAGLWAVWPDFERHHFHLPVAPAALRWFAEVHYPAWTARKRLVEALLRRGGGLWSARALTRCFAGLAVAGESVETGEAGSAPEPAVLIRHGAERVAVLPFPSRASAPSRVVKRPRGPAGDGDRKNRDERAALARIRPRLDAETAAALPRCLDGGAESCVPGVSMSRRMALWGVPRRERVEDLGHAAGWLARFHRQTGVERRAWSDGDTRAWIEEPLSAFRSFAGSGDRWVEGLLGAARRRAADLEAAALPLVWCHRDFTPWNLFVGLDPRVLSGVIDWEGARPGPALCDLLHFATHWHEGARRAFTPEARRRAFLDLFARRRGAEAEAAGGALAEYCQALDLDLRLLPLLLLYTRVEIVTRRLERPGRSRSGGGPWLLSDAAYVGWLAESFDEVVAAWR